MQIAGEKYYMEMPTDFDYRVMEGIVRACSPAGSEWEGIVSKYNRGERTIRFHYSGLYPEKCLKFITEVSKKLDSCAEATEEMREQLMDVEFEVTAYQEDSYHTAEQYRVVRKNGRATVLDGSGGVPFSVELDEFESYEDFLEYMEGDDVRVWDDDRPIDVICREIWPEEEDLLDPWLNFWMYDGGGVYIHGDPPETEWRDRGDLYQIKFTKRKNKYGYDYYDMNFNMKYGFDADDMITKAMDESGIPHDEHTLAELSTQDVYDILGGTYDREKSKNRLTSDMLRGKNFVLSTFHSSNNKRSAEWAIQFVNGKIQSEIGPDTDFVVYSEKLADRGDNYRLALASNEQGRNIRLISLADLNNAVLL